MNIITSDITRSHQVSGNIVEQLLGSHAIDYISNKVNLPNMNLYYISRHRSDMVNDYPDLAPFMTHISSVGHRNSDKLSHSKLMNIIEKLDSDNSIFIIKDYLDSVHVYDRGDKRFIAQMHSLRKFSGHVLVGYDIHSYIDITNQNINISYHRNTSENAKQLHRDLRNPNVSHILHIDSDSTFRGYDVRNYSPSLENVTTSEDWNRLNEWIMETMIVAASLNFIDYEVGKGFVDVPKDSLRYKKKEFVKVNGRIIEGKASFIYLSIRNFLLATYCIDNNLHDKSKFYNQDEFGGRFHGINLKTKLLNEYITDNTKSEEYYSYVMGTEFHELGKLIKALIRSFNMTLHEALNKITETLYTSEVSLITNNKN